MAYVGWAADPSRLANATLMALAAQLAAFVVCVHIAGARSRTRLGVGSPLAWILAVCVFYLIYPSVLWCVGGSFHWDEFVTPDRATTLFVLHALFMLCITCGYTAVSGRAQTVVAEAPPRSSFLAVVLFCGPVLAVMLQRLLTAGSVLPATSYGDSWQTAYKEVVNARLAGGQSYVFAQIMSKVGMYASMLQAIGAALMLSRAIAEKRRRAATLVAVGLVYALTYFVSIGGRSPVLISGIVALSLTDRLAGPIRWRMILPVVAVALAAFAPLSIYRTHAEASVTDRIDATIREYRESRSGDATGEFGPMLSKEAVALQLSDTSSFADSLYVFRSVLMSLVPSQLLPEKMNWRYTHDTLSNVLLGERTVAETNAGVAGTVIGDGYRTWGMWGVALLGLVDGLLVGLACRWLGQAPLVSSSQPFRVLRVALLATLGGMSFLVIRSGLGELLAYIAYYIALPLFAAFVLSFLSRQRLQPAIVERKIRFSTNG